MKIKQIEGIGIALSVQQIMATLLDHAQRHKKRVFILTFNEDDEPESIMCLPLSNEKTKELLLKSAATLDDITNEYILAELPSAEDITEAFNPSKDIKH